MRLAIFGPPGAGKGTQAQRIAQRWQLPHVSTGEMLRAAVASGSELGQRVKEVLEAGMLVDDALMTDLVADRLGQPDAAGGFLLDGFPRNETQVEILDGILGGGRDLDRVLLLEVPDEEAVARLLKRAGIEGRADDNEETIRARLAVYREQTAPVAAVYERRGRLARVEGTGSIDVVFGRIESLLGG